LRQRIIPLLIAGSVAVAAGCGGEDSQTQEERDVRAAVESFVRGIAARDYDQVCRVVTQDVKKSWAEFARRNPKHFSTAGCAAFARDFYRAAATGPRAVRRDMRAIDRSSVRVSGDRDTLTAHPSDRRKGKDDTSVLKKVGGRWLLGD
jgi:ketosteroid isomerase-like protein